MIMDGEAPVQPSGNRCGHDPEAPRWFAPPEEHGTRPTSWSAGRCSAGIALAFAPPPARRTIAPLAPRTR